MTDTIGAVIPQPIHFQVFDADGEPMGGTRVGLIYMVDRMGNPVPGLRVFPTDGRLYVTLEDAQAGRTTESEYVTTDAAGRASVYLRLGDAIGDIHVKAVSGEHRDSVPFHVLAGNATGVGAAPADTAIGVGGSYALTAFAIDRMGNRRPGPAPDVTVTSSAPEEVQTNGAVVEGVAMGRAAIDLTSAEGTATVYVSVVPSAMFAATPDVYAPAPGEAPVLLAADGGAGDPIDGVDGGSCPAWHPDGDRLLFDGLRVVTTAGERTQIATGNPDLIAGCGRFSADGLWIYFDGRSAGEPATASQVWRIGADGTGLAQITSAPEVLRAAGASPSPDGTRLAYVVAMANGLEALVVHTLATGVADTIVEPGLRMRVSWSPTGEWIAYTYNTSSGLMYEVSPRQFAFADQVALVRPDGTDGHSLPNAGMAADHNLRGAVSWSPDGRWIAGKAFFISSQHIEDSRIKLMNITTGETLPLNGTTNAHDEPAWRPQQE